MKYMICAVRDTAVDAFMRPFVVQHVGAAIRGFGDECANPQSVFGQHPDDFLLFHIGTFDEDTGLVESLPQAIMLVRGRDMKGGGNNGPLKASAGAQQAQGQS